MIRRLATGFARTARYTQETIFGAEYVFRGDARRTGSGQRNLVGVCRQPADGCRNHGKFL